jgi:hypothetical protein
MANPQDRPDDASAPPAEQAAVPPPPPVHQVPPPPPAATETPAPVDSSGPGGYGPAKAAKKTPPKKAHAKAAKKAQKHRPRKRQPKRYPTRNHRLSKRPLRRHNPPAPNHPASRLFQRAPRPTATSPRRPKKPLRKPSQPSRQQMTRFPRSRHGNQPVAPPCHWRWPLRSACWRWYWSGSYGGAEAESPISMSR